jgi:hypothetical protein
MVPASKSPREETRAVRLAKCERYESARRFHAWIESLSWPDLTGVLAEKTKEWERRSTSE